MSSTALLLSVLKREELSKTSYEAVNRQPENKENMEDISLRKLAPESTSSLNNKRQIQSTTNILHKLYANQKKKLDWSAYDVRL